MAVTVTPRFGVTRWSAGTDLFTRAHMDDSHAAIETKGAIYLQSTASARPAAGTAGRFHYATDTLTFTYDDGTGWRNVSSPDTVTLTATQTLTNKTLTSPVVNGTVTGSATYSNMVGISTPEFIQWDTSHSQTIAVGKMQWNDQDGTLDLGLKGGNVVLQMGQELVARVANATGSPLLNGRAVYVSGANGDRKQVTYAQANSEATSSKTFGILTETIGNGTEGYVTLFGIVRGIDTSTYTIGAPLWLSPTTPGGLTATRPTFPNHAVFIGWVTRVHATVGEVYVNVQNGYELDELHDVVIGTLANKDVLFYDGSKWINKPLASALDGITFSGTVALPSTTSIGDVSSTEISYLDGVTSSIQTQLNSKAALASPALTGTPTAPTAALGTSTTQIATTDFVVKQIDSQATGFVASFMMAGLG